MGRKGTAGSTIFLKTKTKQALANKKIHPRESFDEALCRVLGIKCSGQQQEEE